MKKTITILAAAVMLASCGSAAETSAPQNEDWGIELTLSEVTSKSAKLTIDELHSCSKGSLQTGGDFKLEKKDKKGYTEIKPIQQTAFTAEAYIITGCTPFEQDINWSAVYGELSAGDYRLVKDIMAFRKAGDYDEQTYYVEFTVN